MYIELDFGMRFSASHIIPGHDKCGRLHGHNYSVSVRLYGSKSAEGIIFDFVELKERLRTILDELDHRLLLPTLNDKMKIEVCGTTVEVGIGNKSYKFPKEDVVLLDLNVISAEELGDYIVTRLIGDLKNSKNIVEIEIGIEEVIGQRVWVKKKLYNL
jgi:6-pyruvoyltetrahydropterin/6-carboxytetrahydropterin synthase